MTSLHREFKIQEQRLFYTTSEEVVDRMQYVIREKCRWYWIFGKRKWRNYLIWGYGGMLGAVYFSELKDAKKYLKDLRKAYKEVKNG